MKFRRIEKFFHHELKNKQFKNSLEKLLPRKMIEPVIELTGINPEKRINEITREERRRLAELLDSRPCGKKGILLRKDAFFTSSLKNLTEKLNLSTSPLARLIMYGA